MNDRVSQRDHERARALAAARPDGFLDAGETAWLDAHLAACDPCRAVASDFDAQRSLFGAARGEFPDVPRDLWARTAAAIEAEGGSRSVSRRRGGLRLGSWTLAPLAAVMVVAIAVGAGLLNGLPLKESTSKGEEPDATPFALEAGEIRVLSQGEDGSLEFRKQNVTEVCPVGASTCSLSPTPEVTQTERIAGASSWDAIISPANDQLVVVERGDGAQGVFVVPLRDDTAAATPTPETPTAPPATVAPTEPPAATAPPETASPSAPPSPADTAAPSADPSAAPDASADASAEPSSEVAGGDTTAEPTPTPPVTTPEPTPAPTPRATPSVAITPRPDGAIEIARNVSIVGNAAAYSPDGSRFAFAARASDGSAGPDVYVWRVGDAKADAVTDDHASLFSGWLGKDLLVSRVEGKDTRTYLRSPDGSETLAHDGSMWLPTVDPKGRTAIWWDGTVNASGDGTIWAPGRGSLVLERWPDGGALQQVLAGDGITDWQVRWDEQGKVLAVWTTKGAPGEPGTLSLYTVDPETGLADLAAPKLDRQPAFDGFSLKPGRLTWSAPADGGDSTVQVLAWSGDTFGRLEILTEGGATVVR